MDGRASLQYTERLKVTLTLEADVLESDRIVTERGVAEMFHVGYETIIKCFKKTKIYV